MLLPHMLQKKKEEEKNKVEKVENSFRSFFSPLSVE
jgi:hypothetical protein